MLARWKIEPNKKFGALLDSPDLSVEALIYRGNFRKANTEDREQCSQMSKTFRGREICNEE